MQPAPVFLDFHLRNNRRAVPLTGTEWAPPVIGKAPTQCRAMLPLIDRQPDRVSVIC